MCGIAGVIGRWPGLDPVRFRDQAFRLLAHRGPNGQGAHAWDDRGFVACPVGSVPTDAKGLLIHTRLSIIDLTEAGAQPMVDPTGRFALVFNGEIYNYVELRRTLAAAGVSTRSTGDSEVLLHWMDLHGVARLRDLVGMFAFCHVDRSTGRFILARDGLGIKPLFYAVRGSSLAFASELPVLLELPGISRKCTPSRAVQSLRSGMAEPQAQSIFSDVRELLPGEVLVGDINAPERATPIRWYELPEHPTFRGTRAEAGEAFREAFLQSLDLHLRSDRRVGTALSGGIDSSSVVMGMRHLRGADLDLTCISFIANTPRLSEERWSTIVSEAAGAQLHKVRASECDLIGDLDAFIRCQGEPMGGTSAYAQYCVYRCAQAEGITVMLDGQGPDEMLAGYDFYIVTRLRELLRAGRLREAGELFSSEHVRSKGHRRALVLKALGGGLLGHGVGERVRGLLGRPSVAPWLWASSARGVIVADLGRSRTPTLNGLSAHLRHSTGNGLVNLFRLADRNAMRFSIENRVPFASTQMADLVFSFPPELMFGVDGSAKAILRDAMRGIVPDVILDRRDKIGFANDDVANLLLAREWVEATIAETAASCPFVDQPALLVAWRRFVSTGRGPVAWLWSTVIFLRWWSLWRVEG